MPLDGSKNAKKQQHLGFLTVLDHGDDGLFGGYLVTNTIGRPLEFHCTAPIKPNRAQEILYGPTLQPYLYGEQIGQTLLRKSSDAPLVVCTDRSAVLCVRDFVETPVALVFSDQAEKKWRIDQSHTEENGLEEFHLGRNHLAVSGRFAAERGEISKRLADLAESFDLAEPFGRIRDAIEEARRGGR